MSAALSRPAAMLAAHEAAIERWLAAEFARQTVPFYCSVDLRANDRKIAPVDTNLFPGGFNNLAGAHRTAAAAAARDLLAARWPKARRVAIVVERMTRNPYYASHLAVLRDVLAGAGVDVRLAFLDGAAAAISGHHREVEVGALARTGARLSVGDFVPDLVLLNHDQTSGVPAILEGVDVEVTPALAAGWSQRRKSAHFFQYERVCGRFAREIGIDPWPLQAYFNVCNRVDVSRRIGLDCLARAVEETLADINANLARFGCTGKPFVVLKADAGTHGMGVVMLESVDEARQLNRSQRKALSVIKDGAAVRDILIQEGVPTASRVEGLVAEPVHYMVGTTVVGGFWRLNQAKGERANLNSGGMLFWPLAPGHLPAAELYAQQVVARLALLATSRELAGDLASGN